MHVHWHNCRLTFRLHAATCWVAREKQKQSKCFRDLIWFLGQQKERTALRTAMSLCLSWHWLMLLKQASILASEDWWFERGVKESISVKLELLSLNSGGGLRHYLSPTYNAALSSLPRQFNNHSHLGSPSPNNPHQGRLDQRPTSGPNNSETQSSQMSLTTL